MSHKLKETSKKDSLKGFTLLELLISSTILAVLLSSAWFSFSAIQRAANSSNERYAFLIDATIATREIQKLLQEASPYTQQGKDTFFKGTSKIIQLTSTHNKKRLTPQQFAEIKIESSKFTIVANQFDWLLRKTDGIKKTDGIEKTHKQIFPNIREVKFKYGDGDDDHWKNEWDLTKKGRLPDVISIELTMNSAKGKEFTYKQLVKVKLMKDSGLR